MAKGKEAGRLRREKVGKGDAFFVVVRVNDFVGDFLSLFSRTR